ncbi:MAG: UDP-N-acetylmuramoyl-L-alanine--D-glutamate ligase [Granulosicoccaceae bacterium]
MKSEQLHKQKVLVVGLGVTGWSVVRYLQANDVAFAVADEKAQPGKDTYALGEAQLHTQFDAATFTAVGVIVLSPGVPRSHPALVAALANGVKVIGDIELFASAVNKPVIAVTGSNGKSTVVSWMAHILAQTQIDAVLCGNIGKPALDSINLAADVYVLELSSYQLESTESLAPLAASVLNISDDHMDRYDSLEHYAQVKRHIYNNCEHVIANRDDARTWPISDTVSASFSANSETYFAVDTNNASDYRCIDRDNKCWVCKGDKELLVLSSTRLPGRHNRANALATVALLAPLDIDQNILQASINTFAGLPHRTELVAELNQVLWYNDSKGTNIDACEKAIEAMPGPVVLIAGGLGKGADFRALRPAVSKCVKALVLIGRDRQLMAEALQDLADVRFCDSMNDAVLAASEIAVAGDAVLMSPACASFDMFDNFEQRGIRFCEAVQALAA